MTKQQQKTLINFWNGSKDYPILIGLSAGLYPIVFYYSKKFTLVNSWEQLGFFMILFLLIPVLISIALHSLFKLSSLKRYQKYVLPFLNIFFFLFFLKMCLYVGIQKKLIVIIFVVSVLFARFFFKYIYRVVLFQFILALIGMGSLLLVLIHHLNYSDDWLALPDDIEKVKFKKTPNVYYIQPDGYVNFSEMKKGHYDLDNSEFEDFIKRENFVSYPNFRSNYSNTMSSNSSIFTMKHHYYNLGEDNQIKINGSSIIASKNAVLDIFKNNGYKTHFLTEVSYFFLNRPKLGYDASNFNRSEIPFIYKGFKERKSVIPSLREYIEEDADRNKFFFIEILAPWHINSSSANSLGRDAEKKLWLKNLNESNQILKETIELIIKNDPNALILIMADHGGFVGLDFTKQISKNITDRDILYSAFSSILAVHWPNGNPPVFDTNFKSAVNVFRILFAYLSEDESYLLRQEDNSSYLIVNKEASSGVYECINEKGEIVFKKYDRD